MNENELWYVKSAIHRGMNALEQGIADAHRTLSTVTDETPARGTIMEVCRNVISYNEQLLREMKQYIPAELQL